MQDIISMFFLLQILRVKSDKYSRSSGSKAKSSKYLFYLTTIDIVKEPLDSKYLFHQKI